MICCTIPVLYDFPVKSVFMGKMLYKFQPVFGSFRSALQVIESKINTCPFEVVCSFVKLGKIFHAIVKKPLNSMFQGKIVKNSQKMF